MTALQLRSDLIEIDDGGNPRCAKIVDAVSGRVARISRRDLKQLRKLGSDATASAGDHAGDEALLNQAAAMGLLRWRAVRRGGRWFGLQILAPQRWLFVRIPLFSIDRVAAHLAPHSGALFHPLALVLWSLAILLAGASVLVGWERAIESAAELRIWTGASSAGWLTIALVFVMTKICHELAHAIACRRAGAACGEVGVLLFAGIPCPYCDVSQVSRLDRPLQRCGVMLSGIYVELILATLATLLWWAAPPGPVQAIAINVMIVCGISTVLFNANPLMRMDGYYVLADLVGAANLRARAAAAWQGLITSRLAGSNRGQLPLSLRELAFALYHAASLVYRTMLLFAIGWMMVAVSDSFGLRPVGAALFALLMLPLLVALVSVAMALLRGRGPWQQSSFLRRMTLAATTAALVATLLLTPLRRELVVSGVIDIADAIEVHAGQSGWVVDVLQDYGSSVSKDQVLLELDDPRLQLELATWDSRVRMASLQSAALRRSALRDRSPDMAWNLDAANQELVRQQWQSLKQREQRLMIRSPGNGILLPPSLDREQGSGAADIAAAGTKGSLQHRCGSYAEAQECLCRIGDPNNLCVTLFIDAKHRRRIHSGLPVRIIADLGAPWVDDAFVESISEIAATGSASHALWGEDQRQFDVRCALSPAAVQGSGVQSLVGCEVQARIHVGDESLWQWLCRAWRESWGE